jgi:hypothetical protein
MVDTDQKATRPDNIGAAFRRAGIRTKWSVKTQALFAKVSPDAATEVRHRQFSKARIKCNVTEARCSQQTKIAKESGKWVKQRIQSALSIKCSSDSGRSLSVSMGIDCQFSTDRVTLTSLSYLEYFFLSLHLI